MWKFWLSAESAEAEAESFESKYVYLTSKFQNKQNTFSV